MEKLALFRLAGIRFGAVRVCWHDRVQGLSDLFSVGEGGGKWGVHRLPYGRLLPIRKEVVDLGPKNF